MRVLLSLGLSVLMIGCASDRMGSQLASWQGRHFNDVAAVWGPPDECSTGDPARICEWHVQSTVATAATETTGGEACTTMLAFDPKGHVTGWRWRGNRCQNAATIAALNGGRERPDALALVVDDDSVPEVAVAAPTADSKLR